MGRTRPGSSTPSPATTTSTAWPSARTRAPATASPASATASTATRASPASALPAPTTARTAASATLRSSSPARRARPTRRPGRHEARGVRLRSRIPRAGLFAPGVPVGHGHPLGHGQHEGPGLLGARIVRLRLGPLQMLLGLLRHEVPDADGTRVEYPVRASPLSLI